MGGLVAAVIVGAVCLAGLLAGEEAFGWAVVAVAAVTLADFSGLLGRAGERPVVPAAAVAALGPPLAVIIGPARMPLDQLPALFAVAGLLAFALVIGFGRRSGAVAGLGATALVGLIIGLGAAGLIVLRALPDGLALVGGLLALVLTAEIAAAVPELLTRWQEANHDALATRITLSGNAEVQDRTSTVPPALPPVLGVLIVAVGLAVLVDPPFEPLVIAAMALLVLVAVFAVQHLHRDLAARAGIAPDEPVTIALGAGLVVRGASALLTAAPVSYLAVRAVGA